MDVFVKNETSEISAVILGIANDLGGTPTINACYDPDSKFHVLNNSFPNELDLIEEMDTFKSVLEAYNVEVLRPKNIEGVNQVFARDIGFVIENKFIKPNIIEDRAKEIDAIEHIINKIGIDQVIETPKDVFIEGGDILLFNDYIFIGVSNNSDFEKYKVARTNEKSLDFIQSIFPNKQIITLELNKSDDDYTNNFLHLDCCMQPIGINKLILNPKGLKNANDIQLLEDIFGAENIIFATSAIANNMFSNVFSISQNVVVSDKRFTQLNKKLVEHGFKVEAIKYSEVAKMGGLFRCSTLPIKRNESNYK